MPAPLPARTAPRSARTVRRASVVGVILLAAATACTATEEPSPGTPSAPPSAGSSDAPPTDPRLSPSAGPTPLATPAPEPPALALEQVAAGLSSPINLVADRDGRLYVNERDGRVRVIEPDGTLRPEPFLDLTDRIAGGGERGLLGLALHPEYPAAGRVFAHYTDLDGNTVLSEFGLAPLACPACPPIGDSSSERILLTALQPAANHNGGQLAFGPDGYLYLGLGDGGGADDVFGNGQDPFTLLGSILRIDVDGAQPYAIPADNPFADGADGAPEVYLWGLRNPWRFSFDRATGDLWIGDVGQGSWEEVDRLGPDDAGANLGWNLMEGAHCFAVDPCGRADLVLPLAEYPTHEVGCAIIGGFVYRGAAIPDLVGWYVFSDACSGPLFGVASNASPASGATAPLADLGATGLQVSTFGEGSDGELYLADLEGGAVYRIVAGD